jgi:hypothetical protein
MSNRRVCDVAGGMYRGAIMQEPIRRRGALPAAGRFPWLGAPYRVGSRIWGFLPNTLFRVITAM